MTTELQLWTLVTPVIITFNEENNIGRLLESFKSFEMVIVVDSFSTDNTSKICQKYNNVHFIRRHFTSFSDQCNYAIALNIIETDWVLSVDADYVFSREVMNEMNDKLIDSNETQGYSAKFRYCIEGKEIHGSIYPPVTVLFNKNLSEYIQDGHAHRIVVNGKIDTLNYPLLHDDRKPLSHWLNSQYKYALIEAEKLKKTPFAKLNWKDKLRRAGLGPVIVPALVLFFKGGILSGRYGLMYAAQRAIAEWLIAYFTWSKTSSTDK